MADHFRIDRFGNPAVQQTSQTLKVVDKGGYQRIRRRRLQQTANQLGVIAAKRLLNLMRSKAIALLLCQLISWLVVLPAAETTIISPPANTPS